ncbi:hypothetical protein D918_03351 [Trichuris suis]|nr:hypothetical protein D918_03351 [Trichuris suis]
MVQGQLSCACIIAFICLYLSMVSGRDVLGLLFGNFSRIFHYHMESRKCKTAVPFVANFTRPYYFLNQSEVVFHQEVWSRILLYTLTDEATLFDFIRLDIINTNPPYFHKAGTERMWVKPPLPLETDPEKIMSQMDFARLRYYHKNYYKRFRDIELSRLQLVNCDELWLHPATLQHYSVKFVAAEAPFKVPCQVCTKKRYSSNIRNVFFKCSIKAFIEVDKGGESTSSCQPFYQHAWDIEKKIAGNPAMSIVEQMYGDQLRDGGGFYLHFFPLNEKVYGLSDSAKADLVAFSSGIFYCKEGQEGEDVLYPEAEVIQVVDIVSFKQAKKYDTYKEFIHVPLNSTCGVPLNLQYHIIWQNAERCCSPRDGDERVKFGIVTVRKIDPTKTIFWDTAPINRASVVPTAEKFDGYLESLGLIDIALSLPFFYDYGIRISCTYARELHFEYIMRKLLHPPMPSSGVLYYSQNCEQSDKDTDMHRVIERKGNLQVEFRLHQHIIVSCVDPGKKLPDVQSITWQKDKGHVIRKCRGLNKTFVINGELHVHAATLEDVGTYICKRFAIMFSNLLALARGQCVSALRALYRVGKVWIRTIDSF